MLLNQERKDIVRFGRKLISANLTTGAGGNLSVINRALNLIAIKPSGVAYQDLEAEDIVIISPQGEIIEGSLKPSSEKHFHLALYQARPHIHAIIHTHQVYATTLACLQWELPAVHYLVGFSGDKVPLAPYAPYGTPELAEHIVASMGTYNACLMANHGLVTVGENLEAAFTVAEQIELVAHIYLLSKSVGNPVILGDADMKTVIEKFQSYGQANHPYPPQSSNSNLT
jgi:L-fuculose-phosphate aldolase